MGFGSKGGDFEVYYDTDKQMLMYNVIVPYNTWFGVVYGEGMDKTDMMWLSAG